MGSVGREHITYTTGQLCEFAKLPPSEILDWLEEFLEFLEEAMTPEAKRVFEKFRSGELEYPAKK